MKKLITLTILMLVFAGLIIAQTNTWKSATTNPDRGKWNVAANWSLNVIPTSSHDVVIPTTPVNQVFFPTLNASNAVCKTLTIQSGASVTGATGLSLTVSGDVVVTGTLNVSASPVNVSGNVTINGSITYTTGRMNVSGTLTHNNLSGTGVKVLYSANNYIDIRTAGITSITIQAFANTAPPNTPPEYDATKGVNRYYAISSVTGNGFASLKLDYLLGEKGANLTPTDAIVWQYRISGPWLDQGGINMGSYFTETSSPIDASELTGNYAIAHGAAAMPVQLASFIYDLINGNDVQLEWMTISETNNYGFYVQKYNAIINDFETIEESFQPGAGSTLVPQNYSWIDENVVSRKVEYRLKQVDTDGLVHFSDPIVVMLNPPLMPDVDAVPAVFKLNQNYPNPFNPLTMISFSLADAGYTTLKVYNILGNEVATLFSGNGSFSTSWNDKQNWVEKNVPTASDQVIIPNGLSRYPILGAASVCASLSMATGTTLNMSNFNLSVGGDATISGSLSYGTGRMIVGGALTRNNISGTGIKYLLSANNYINITTAGITSITIRAFANTAPPNTPPEYDATKGVTRYYTITGVTGTGEARPRFDYLASEMGSAFTPTQANVWQYISGPWINLGMLNAATHYSEPELPLNQSELSGIYAIADGAAAMPVQLASFIYDLINENDVQLEWMTISETNNYGFYVQKYNAINNDFETIEESFQPGAGSTLVPQNYSWIDENVVSRKVEYRLKQVDTDGLVHFSNPIVVMLNLPLIPDVEAVPAVFKLNQNYPNPFNPSTVISWQLAISGYTTLKVYNILGNEVATLFSGKAEAGKMYNVNFDASKLATGIYIYKLQNGSNTEVKKLTLLK